MGTDCHSDGNHERIFENDFEKHQQMTKRMKHYKVRKKANIRKRYNQLPHLTQDTALESDKTQENIRYKRDKRFAPSPGYFLFAHKALCQ